MSVNLSEDIWQNKELRTLDRLDVSAFSFAMLLKKLELCSSNSFHNFEQWHIVERHCGRVLNELEKKQLLYSW